LKERSGLLSSQQPSWSFRETCHLS